MLRQRRALNNEQLLPHHHSFSAEGAPLALPQRRRQVRAARTFAIFGVLCLSVMLLVAAGAALKLKSTRIGQEPNDHHDEDRYSRRSEELLHSKSEPLEQGSKSQRKQLGRNPVNRGPVTFGLNRTEAPPVPPDRTGNVPVLNHPEHGRPHSLPHEDKLTGAPNRISLNLLNVTFQGNSTTQVICPGGSIGNLNDDYCDCSDGSDETKTSACSHVLAQKAVFLCGDGTGAIFTSRVGDGVIDCADGSDEKGKQKRASRANKRIVT